MGPEDILLLLITSMGPEDWTLRIYQFINGYDKNHISRLVADNAKRSHRQFLNKTNFNKHDLIDLTGIVITGLIADSDLECGTLE